MLRDRSFILQRRKIAGLFQSLGEREKKKKLTQQPKLSSTEQELAARELKSSGKIRQRSYRHKHFTPVRTSLCLCVSAKS